MKQERLVRLLCELIKNSRRSDRDLAKILGISQPSVSRLRKVLERDAILEYTAIPNFSYLGFDILAFTFGRTKEPAPAPLNNAVEWLREQPNVVFSSEGQGMEVDRVLVSVHRDYSDFSKFHQSFRREWGPLLENFKTFLISLSGHGPIRHFTFSSLAAYALSNPDIRSQWERWRPSIPSYILKTGPVLNFSGGDSTIVTYTPAADKMRVFSAFIREGLEEGGAAIYIYPDEERETVRARLEENGVAVEEHEEDGALRLMSLTEHFTSKSKLDIGKAVADNLGWWSEARRRGYNHVRDLVDVGDFSFIDGQWQRFLKDYWLDPRWTDPSVSEWVVSKEPGRVRIDPFITEIAAINVGAIGETRVRHILKAFGGGKAPPTRFIDLLEYVDAFSKRIEMVHRQLIGCKFLFEFDPASNYEEAVEDFVKETMANVEPLYVFTSAISPLRKRLAKYSAIKFFSRSTSTSTLQPKSENEVLVPADNIDLTLESVEKVAKTHSEEDVSMVFDGLSEQVASLGLERTFTFLRNTLQTLSPERTTALFLLNSGAHDQKTVSRLRGMFDGQLTFTKKRLQAVKLPRGE